MIEVATILTIFISGFYGSPAVSADVINQIKPAVFDRPVTLEDHVRDYFKDDPILAEIARCESTFRQLTPQGAILRGDSNKADLGVMQINEMYHRKRATGAGFDIDTLDGNLSYARWLYQKEGTRPWNSSKRCWSQITLEATPKLN